MTDTFELDEKLATDLKTIAAFIERVSRKVLELTGREEEGFKVKLALEEALTNAMRHGNALDPARSVRVRITAHKENITIDIHDEGAGFDFKCVPDPTHSEHCVKPSGRGVFLMRKLMDKVEYYDGGSGVTMIKHFPVNG